MILPSMAQDEVEFDMFLGEIAKIPDLESILEIGVWQGGTLARFASRFPYATVIGIDPNPMIERWAPEWGEYHMITGESQDTEAQGKVMTENQHRKFSVVWIDGDHEYEPCRQDWLWANTIATKIIAFHDIVDSNNDMIQVHMLWRGIHDSPMYRTKEIKNAGGNYGIGVVYL